MLESDEPLDREKLLNQYSQWASDLHRFIDNWLAMEHQTASLAVKEFLACDEASENLNGKIVGDYELLELISTGGMGVVYRARQTSLSRIVALKMVLNTIRDKTRFRIEAEAAASLHHANIIAIHEVGEFEGQPFLSMQYVSGGNLHEHLKTGPMAPRAAAVLVRTIATAVHYAHQRGILHRDLKPANVLLDKERGPFVTDFGLAKQMGNSVELTRSGAIIGTPGYMAPEQAMGQVKSITVAADVYGLGAILYATLTGEAPFKSDSDLVTLRKVIEETPTSPRAKRPELDRNLDTICMKCLEKTPASRYSSAKKLADDLSHYLRGEPVEARPIGIIERRWRWCRRNPTLAFISFFAGLLVTAILLILAGVVWREYVARLNVEFTRIREAAMTEAIDTARADAEKKNQAAQQAIADLYTTNGLWADRTNSYGESLLWFSRAAQLKGIDQARTQHSRSRCLSWLSQCPKPIAVFQLGATLPQATFQRDWPLWQLSNSELMFKSDLGFGIWNFESEEIWRPTGQEFQVSAASWKHDGRELVLGSTDGELRLLDATTKATKKMILLDQEITSAAFTTSGKKLCIGTASKVMVLNSHNLAIESDFQVTASCVAVRFSNDETKIYVVTADGAVTVYSLVDGTLRSMMRAGCFMAQQSSFAQSMMPEFSQDGNKLFVRTEQRSVRIFDTNNGKQIGQPILTGHTESVALSPGQSYCAVGGENYARLQSIHWKENTPTFERHNSPLCHNNAVTTLAFGGKQLISTGGRDRLVQIWSVGELMLPGVLLNQPAIPLATLPHTHDVVGMLFPNGGRQLVTIQQDGIVRVWQLPSFEPPGYISRGTRGGFVAKPMDTERWLIAGATHWRSNAINASLRRLKDGVVVAETPLHGLDERGHLLDAVVTAKQDKLISLHANPRRSGTTMETSDETAGSIQVWKLPSGEPSGSCIRLRAEPRSIVLHPSGDKAAVLLVNRDILIIDVIASSIIKTLYSSQTEIDWNTGQFPRNFRNGQLQFFAGGDLLVSWGIGKGLAVWDWQVDRQPFSTNFADDWTVRHLALSPTQSHIAAAIDETNSVVLIDGRDGRVLREFLHASQVDSVEFSPSGKELLTACQDGKARIFDCQSMDRKEIELAHDKRVLDACFSPDGLCVATLTNEMRVLVWHIQDRQWALKPMSAPLGTQEILYGLDSRHIITMGLGSDSRVLDLTSFNGTQELDLQSVDMLGELLSSRSIDENGIVNLTSEKWLERWKVYKNTFLK